MVWKIDDPQGAEVAKIRHLVAQYTRGHGLDVGCGPWPLWPGVTSIDDMDEWQGHDWRPGIIGDCTKLAMFTDRCVDFVFNSHVIEHVDDAQAALKEWWRVIKVGGFLVSYVPHADLYPRMGQPGANPDHKRDLLPEDFYAMLDQLPGGWDMVFNQTRGGGYEYSFLIVIQKLKGSKREYSYKERAKAKEGKKTVCVIRYGGIGDCMQAMSVFPWFHENGWHTTFMTSENGAEIAVADPNIDEVWFQERDQVPDKYLLEYWAALGQEFDKVVNLCESVEGSLLKIPGRRDHALPLAARRLQSDVNYHEMIHAIAGVPMPMRQDFYHTREELDWAKDLKAKLPGPAVVYCPMGTSVHKLWPHCADFFCHVIDTHPLATIISLGGKQEQQTFERPVLEKLCHHYCETPYGALKKLPLQALPGLLTARLGAKRIFWHAGLWSIRQTAAFLRVAADVIVGPETGMMNIAGPMDVPKILMLSHSSHNMLSRYWTNTVAIESRGCRESPCMRMHYNWNYCYRDEKTKAALCSAAISGAEVADLVLGVIKPKAEAAE